MRNEHLLFTHKNRIVDDTRDRGEAQAPDTITEESSPRDACQARRQAGDHIVNKG